MNRPLVTARSGKHVLLRQQTVEAVAAGKRVLLVKSDGNHVIEPYDIDTAIKLLEKP